MELRHLDKSLSLSPSERADRAIILLLGGKLERAIIELEDAHSSEPSNGVIASDLSALYISRGDRVGDPIDFVRALSLAEGALELDPRFKEAMFNRALALDRLFISIEAKNAWLRFIGAASGTNWAMEARDRVRKIQTSIIQANPAAAGHSLEKDVTICDLGYIKYIAAKFPQASRRFGEEKLLYQWSQHMSRQEYDIANKYLAAAQAIGEVLAEKCHDQMLLDSVSAIRNSLAKDPERVRYLVNGHDIFGLGLSAYEGERYGDAVEYFERAREFLSRGGSPFYYWAVVNLAVCQYYIASYKASMATLQSVSVKLQRFKYIYPVLLARLGWMRGLILFETGHSFSALPDYAKSLDLYLSSGELENSAAVENLISVAYDDLGEFRKAWEFRYKSLSKRGLLTSRRRLHNVLDIAAEASLRLSYPRVALDFQNEAVNVATSANKPLELAVAFLRRAMIQHSLGHNRLAASDIERSHFYCDGIPDLAVRRGLEADAALVEGSVLRVEHPGVALKHLSHAIEEYDTTEFRLRLPRLYEERALVHVNLGEYKLGEQDLDQAISMREDQRTDIEGGDVRLSFFDQMSDLFGEAINLQRSLKNQDKAFNLSERARAQSLLDSIQPFGSRIPSVRQLQNALPKDVAIISYYSTADRLWVWLITSTGFRGMVIEVSRARLRFLLTRLEESLSSREFPEADVRAELRELHSLFLAPLGGEIRSKSKLVIIPDFWLSEVPFCALLGRETNRYLVEDYSISVLPSASVYYWLLQRNNKRVLSHPSVLSIGDPQIDRTITPELPMLPRAAEEALRVRMMYSRGSVLLHQDAGKARFLAEAGSYDVIHFAGHAISTGRKEVALVMARPLSKPSTYSDFVFSSDFKKINLRHVRLFVLGACSTGSVGEHTGEGGGGLGWTLLASGISSVVSTLWAIDDTSGIEVFAKFHGAFAGGNGAGESLRVAQIGMLNSNNPQWKSPRVWGAFQLSGMQ